jgi:hypothetical protein
MTQISPRNSAAAIPPIFPSANLALFELPKIFAEPMLRLCRLTNTALDVLFYNVAVLTADLLAKGGTIDIRATNSAAAKRPLKVFDLSAATNPSGSIIVVDAQLPPYLRQPFDDMQDFFNHANGPEGAGLHTLTITGVGSSAFGSVAFAWDVSAAIGEPVAAVVPGYGLADVVPQALGGWFGFEMYDRLQSATQHFLATFAPPLAMVGKDLALSTPGRQRAASGAPVFQEGSAASDDVHAILKEVPGITRLVGHSKGALAIENALRSLPEQRTEEISVTTFGCVIGQEKTTKSYTQYLGSFDILGILNSRGQQATYRPFTHHSTNTSMAFSMHVTPSMEGQRQS